MKKDIITVIVLFIFILFIVNLLVKNFTYTDNQIEVFEVQDKKVETLEEKMNRWDKGGFTEEEKSEIELEEKREDKAVSDLIETL